MPIAEPTVLDLRAYTLRHIGPKAVVFPDTPGQSFTVLGRSDLVARPLPTANIPNSSDFVSGKWTGRLFDAGDGQLTWPNKEASDGPPWRYRFDPTNKLQWIEVTVDEYLETVLCITKVTPDRNQVVVDGYDGLQLTKSAYDRDQVVVEAPRDTIERGTQLWVPTTTDSFPAGSLNAQWTPITTVSGTVTVGASGGVVLGTPTASSTARIESGAVSAATSTWRAQVTVQALYFGTGVFRVFVLESSGDSYDIRLSAQAAGGVPTAYLEASGIGNIGQVALPQSPSFSLMLESDGEWVFGFLNGQLIGCVRRLHATTTTVKTVVELDGNSTGLPYTATLTGVLTETLQPFLQRGTDKGDYVLPGSATTYPSGGLHARYYNDGDLQADANRLSKIMAPNRSQAYAGSGTSEYANQQDATINGQANPLPGAATSNWSAKWFGAIYLKLSAGNYTFSFTLPSGAPNNAIRIWVGKTKFGDQLVDDWAFTFGTGSFTVTASALAGTLPYGGGTVQRDGWYPIKIEYAVDGTAAVAPTLKITNSPAAYTDPGGTAITSGAQTTVVPSTSFSPLGMVDQRFQGTSHFDLIQKTAVAFGYQYSLEPKSLESGSFPGVVAPRIREGTDYDLVIEPDDTQRKEGMLNYSAVTDGTDQASSLFGNGAGFQNGTSGQLQGYVYDAPTLQGALFNMQGWQDAADASFLALLQATLNSSLALRLVPWSLVSADPVGRQRLAYTWPLPGTVQQFRWRPGDGARLRALDINVQDTVPRQLLLVTRNIHPNGAVSTQVGFAARPKSGVYANRQALAAALRPQRNYQKQLVTLTGTYINSQNILAGQITSPSLISLSAGDQIVRARVRIDAVTGTAPSIGVRVIGVDQTATLNGPWGVAPVNLDIGAVATPSVANQFYAELINKSGVNAAIVSFQLLVDVLR